MLAVGFAFWGSWPYPIRWFDIVWPGSYADVNLNFWRAMSFSSTFGGALMALGFASLAVARSTDERFLRTACGYFLGGYFFLSFIVFAKAEALWSTPQAFLLLDAVAFPGAGFLYFLILDVSRPRIAMEGPRAEGERAIRDAAGQEERTRLAQDLHDSVKQQIYSIQTNLATAQARWETGATGAREAVEQARTSARDAMAEMVALLDRLRQDPIETVGLVEALRRQCEALGYQTGAAVTTSFGPLPAGERLPPGAMKSVFRIAQEALANVARHARAKHVQLELGENIADDEFVLRIRDDGQGFDTGRPPSGMGLYNMHARATEIGAHLELQSKPGEGSVTAVHLPLLDRYGESERHHRRLLVAVTVPVAPLIWVAWAEPLWRPHVMPLAVVAVAVAAHQAWTLVRLRWL